VVAPRSTPAAIAAALALAATGCASYTQVALQVRDPLVRGDFAAAETLLVAKKPGGDGLPYLMELGLVLRYRGELERSNQVFDEAELLVDDLYTKSISKEALALVTSDETIPYDGEMWERVLVNYYRALNYVDLGSYEDALVECRKINQKLQVYGDASDKPPTYATDAFAQYLTALLYEAGGQVDDAWISLRHADSAYVGYEKAYGLPAPVSLKRDMLRLARQQGYADDERRLRERWGDVEAPSTEELLEKGEIVVFWEEGFIPAKIQQDLFVPILKHDVRDDRLVWARTLAGRAELRPAYEKTELEYLLRIAVPTYPPRAPSERRGWAELSVGGATARSEPVEDLDAIARRGLEDRMGAILFKTILRALAKYAISKGVESKKGDVAGTLVNLVTAATEKADTRSWITLPRAVHLVRLVVPPGVHDVELACHSGGAADAEVVTFEDVEVGAGEVRFLSHRTF
jgi:hypothetical protein